VFGFSLHGWENAMVVFLIIAGFFALLAGAATWAVVRLQRIELAESRQEFDRYKVESGREISAANAMGENAKAESEKAHADIAKANVAIAEADARAAEARAEQERLKQIVSWRVLSSEALAILADRLKGGGSANLTYAANDPEALYLWTQISKAFPQPAWKMIAQARTYEGTFHAGIFINGPDTQDTRTIRNAFKAADIAFGTQELGSPHMFFGDPDIPNAPTVFIASRFPPNR
jgi:hypothetical protein